MVSAMGMNLLLIYLGCKEVETREIEGLVAKLLLALQNLSILTRFLCNIDLVPDSSLLEPVSVGVSWSQLPRLRTR